MAKDAGHHSNIVYEQAQGGLFAARQGTALHKWDNGWKPGATGNVVGTDAGLIYNLDRDEQVIITSWYYGMNTFDDCCQFQLGYTDQADGAGTFTAVLGARAVDSDTTYSFGCRSTVEHLNPPIRVRYSDGARCITIQINVNDTLATVDVGWAGILEKG